MKRRRYTRNMYSHMFQRSKRNRVILFVLLFFLLGFFFVIFRFMRSSPIIEQENTNQQIYFDSNETSALSLASVIKGIAFDQISLYTSHISDTESHSLWMFTCFSSSKQIPYEWINDDYCDCPEDGSDEPGTSSCSKGFFWCKDHSKQIFSSMVNDGICDCCDHSDEYLNASCIQHRSLLCGKQVEEAQNKLHTKRKGVHRQKRKGPPM
eukprot:TRINITY_DN4857_c0_g1_i1.p1 TRINITY_DN4857_c0_g1~~TRINITY_DN4857_c0_g1_i1.p1  ORF type:complete len:209 (+),score=14.96 TRINITY_DN4857_c0_g1_i1:56-682(+)